MTCLHTGWLASLPEQLRKKFIASLRPVDAQALLYDWRFWARPNQLPPQQDWRVWLVLAGRGFGQDADRSGADPSTRGRP